MSDGVRDLILERDLHAAAVRGDALAWRTLYDQAFEEVAGYVRWRSSGLADLVDDVLQETWITAAQRVAQFDPQRCRFASWVCGIANNVLRHQLRSRTRYQRRVTALGEYEPVVVENEDRDRCERVAIALSKLSERHEHVLRAKYFDRQSLAAIAAACGESEKAIESRLSRARQAFREEFEKLS